MELPAWEFKTSIIIKNLRAQKDKVEHARRAGQCKQAGNSQGTKMISRDQKHHNRNEECLWWAYQQTGHNWGKKICDLEATEPIKIFQTETERRKKNLITKEYLRTVGQLQKVIEYQKGKNMRKEQKKYLKSQWLQILPN